MSLLYKKEVLGLNGKPFTYYKIRTMVKNAEELRGELDPEFDAMGKIIDDPRIIRFGKPLRGLFIDEIPQIYNIWRGEMKLVGHRPRSDVEWIPYGEEHRERSFKYPPGLCSVVYAYDPCLNPLGSIEESIRAEAQYWDLYDMDPQGTDREYFLRIWNNIIFQGVRSR